MRKKREWISFDLTPLIDIIFLLLIFFMVFSVFRNEEFVLDINLPTAQSSEKMDTKKLTTIELNSEFISLNGVKITLEELKHNCNTLHKDDLITLSIDKDVKYERIVSLLDILKSKNLSNISLLVNQ